MLKPEDEKKIKRLLAIQLYGEEAILRSEKNAKLIYEIVVDGKKIIKEFIKTKNGLVDKEGKIAYVLLPEMQ